MDFYKFAVSPYLRWICIVYFDLRQCKMIDGIMKKMKCQHNQIWLTTRLAKLSYYVDGIVRLLIYGVKMSFPKRNLNNVLFIPMIFTNYSLDRFKEIKCVTVNFESATQICWY